MTWMLKTLRAMGVVTLVVVLTLWTPTLERAPRDAERTSASAPSLKMAVSSLSALPPRDILSPAALRKLAERARRNYWSVPEDATWPTDAHGDPIVETERVEVLHHTVEPGQSLRRIRTMYRRSREELQKLNPDTDLDDLEDGERLVVWRRNPETVSTSYGASHWGRLYHGEPLPTDENFVILYRHRAFGTHYTVSEITRALDTYYKHYPNADKLVVGDLSFRTGGAIAPHKSHRSGRDVDISFPRTDDPPNYKSFHWMSSRDLAVDKTLDLLKTFIDSGHVRYIFVNRSHQRRLYRAAKRSGATEAWLERVFEYPDWGGKAIIRHSPGHDDHMHIRFKCQPTDRRCR